MNKIRTPTIAAAIAVAIAGSSGYCALRPVAPEGPPPAQADQSPVRLLPEAVIPYPLENLD